MTSYCALCEKEAALSNSHVIPEFLYSEMYDEKHRFRVISTLTDDSPTQMQQGIRERLLCAQCETQLSVPERYASLVFSGALPITSNRTGNLVEVFGLDYVQFRLFGLSILWRAHVARSRFFAVVDLGPHAPEIRRMIRDMDPGPPETYGFFLSPLTMEGEPAGGLMVEPTKSRLGQNRCYRFVFGGLVWVFVVSSHQAPRLFEQAFINREGRMLMLVSELRETSFILDAMHRAIEKERSNAF